MKISKSPFPSIEAPEAIGTGRGVTSSAAPSIEAPEAIGTGRGSGVDQATLAAIYQTFQSPGFRSKVQDLSQFPAQDLGYRKVSVDVPLGDFVKATAWVSDASDEQSPRHFLLEFKSGVGTGFAGPFALPPKAK